MSDNRGQLPVIMCFAENDPTGGAGIQADIETLVSLACHCAPIITSFALPNATQIKPQIDNSPELVAQQAQVVLADIPIAAIKIGFLGNIENIHAVHDLLVDYPNIPIVLDPCLPSHSQINEQDQNYIQKLADLLCPLSMIITPTSVEARLLSGNHESIDACGQTILDFGCEYVLVSGTHEASPAVINSLYGQHGLAETFSWERLPHHYRGAGNTLSAAIAGMLGQRLDPLNCIAEAQEFTYECLKQGYALGIGQHTPNRLFWIHEENHEANPKLN